MLWRMAMRRLLFCAAVLLTATSCTDEAPREAPSPALPASRSDMSTPPDAALLLPSLNDYRVNDHVDAQEVAESLAHGPTDVADVARRLILDDRGFTVGTVTVVTTATGPEGVEDIVTHMFGDVRRTPVDIAGVPMLRVPTQAHDVLAWPGQDFLVVFGRAQEKDHAWLEELARASVRSL